MRYLVSTLPILLFCWTTELSAQIPCPCCTPNHEAFDFWVGDWIVYDTVGNEVGENTIVKLENGCNVSEHWRGSKGSTGRSFNYYSTSDSTWNQLWIDNGGSQLKLKGVAGDNTMTLYSDTQKGKSGIHYKNRVVWSLLDDGSVSQVWDIIDEEENVLQNAFYGIYKKDHNNKNESR